MKAGSTMTCSVRSVRATFPCASPNSRSSLHRSSPRQPGATRDCIGSTTTTPRLLHGPSVLLRNHGPTPTCTSSTTKAKGLVRRPSTVSCARSALADPAAGRVADGVHHLCVGASRRLEHVEAVIGSLFPAHFPKRFHGSQCALHQRPRA